MTQQTHREFYHHIEGETMLTLGQMVVVDGITYTIDEFEHDGFFWCIDEDVNPRCCEIDMVDHIHPCHL